MKKKAIDEMITNSLKTDLKDTKDNFTSLQTQQSAQIQKAAEVQRIQAQVLQIESFLSDQLDEFFEIVDSLEYRTEKLSALLGYIYDCD